MKRTWGRVADGLVPACPDVLALWQHRYHSEISDEGQAQGANEWVIRIASTDYICLRAGRSGFAWRI